MEYSNEQLNKIEELAQIFTPVPEIAALLSLDEDMLMLDINNKNHLARISYLRGMAKTANELRSKNLELALACAPSAIEQCFKDLNKMFDNLY